MQLTGHAANFYKNRNFYKFFAELNVKSYKAHYVCWPNALH